MSFENSYPSKGASHEMDRSQGMPEVSAAIVATFINRKDPMVLACGDDRGFTAESSETLRKVGIPLENAYLRQFGGKFGAARNLLAATAAQYGGGKVRQFAGRNFLHFSNEVASRAEEQGVIMISHSSAEAESNPAFLFGKDSDIGCAYGANIGLVSHLNAADQLAIHTAGTEARNLGLSEDTHINKIAEANQEVTSWMFGDDPQQYKITRVDLKDSKTLAMILAGDHAASKDAVHVYNLTPDRVSDPNEALARGLHYYDSDITQVAEILIKGFPELELDPEILLKTLILDSAATRTALAASDGPADPNRITSQRFGDGQEALDYLSAL